MGVLKVLQRVQLLVCYAREKEGTSLGNINTNITFLDIIHRPVSISKHITFRRLDSVSVFR
jgi:hypothetical protein